MKRLVALSLLSLAATTLADAPTADVVSLNQPPLGTRPASQPATQTSPVLTPADKLAITHHELQLPNGTLRYTATAGYLPLKDDKGNLRANIFYIAYTADPLPVLTTASTTAPSTTTSPAIKPRPVTFAFNGGPGAASAWLHLGTAGPKRIAFNDAGDLPAPPYKLVDNPATWLTDTDLVFIDPVGTGYSRAATPELNKEFFGVHEDATATADFIRLWITKNQRWDSPKFLAGESYGTTRAAVLSELLLDRQGIALNGVILISTVLNFATIRPAEGNDLGYALYLPSYAAAAWYHKKLAIQKDPKAPTFEQFLAQVEDFASTTYTVALTKGAALPEADRQAVAARLAQYTGLPQEVIEKSDLRVDPSRFQKLLLADQSKIVGRFDDRLTAAAEDRLAPYPDFDPSLSTVYPAYTAAFNDYVRTDLHYENDLQYEVLSSRVGPWNWGGGFGGGGQGALYVGDNFASAIRKNAHMKVLVCSGRFDLATPYFATQYTLDHLALPAELRKNITHLYYPGGHMLYHEKSSLQKLHTDIAALIRDTTTR